MFAFVGGKTVATRGTTTAFTISLNRWSPFVGVMRSCTVPQVLIRIAGVTGDKETFDAVRGNRNRCSHSSDTTFAWMPKSHRARAEINSPLLALTETKAVPYSAVSSASISMRFKTALMKPTVAFCFCSSPYLKHKSRWWTLLCGQCVHIGAVQASKVWS